MFTMRAHPPAIDGFTRDHLPETRRLERHQPGSRPGLGRQHERRSEDHAQQRDRQHHRDLADDQFPSGEVLTTDPDVQGIPSRQEGGEWDGGAIPHEERRGGDLV